MFCSNFRKSGHMNHLFILKFSQLIFLVFRYCGSSTGEYNSDVDSAKEVLLPRMHNKGRQNSISLTFRNPVHIWVKIRQPECLKTNISKKVTRKFFKIGRLKVWAIIKTEKWNQWDHLIEVTKHFDFFCVGCYLHIYFILKKITGSSSTSPSPTRTMKSSSSRHG